MPYPNPSKRPIRIGNASGAVGDGLDQIYRLAKAGNVDAITADYLAEFNIAWRAIDIESSGDISSGYEPGFLDQLKYRDGDAARLMVKNGIKVVHNGGALNPQGLAQAVDELLKSLGLADVKIAWVEGDNLAQLARAGELASLKHLDRDLPLGSETNEILSANAYTGQAGIVAALKEGADIVICGRCTDDSPVMGLAYWWHQWTERSLDEMAGALMAGHLIECGPYVTGGNFCGASEIPQIHDLGFPIAEINHDGRFVITKPEGTNGAVTVDTCKAQLLYEIQGSYYLNPDVIALIDEVKVEQVAENRVLVTNTKGLKPPRTTKLAVCLKGGYQGELSAFTVGLDTDFKYNQMKKGVLQRLDKSSTLQLALRNMELPSQIRPQRRKQLFRFECWYKLPRNKPFLTFSAQFSITVLVVIVDCISIWIGGPWSRECTSNTFPR